MRHPIVEIEPKVFHVILALSHRRGTEQNSPELKTHSFRTPAQMSNSMSFGAPKLDDEKYHDTA